MRNVPAARRAFALLSNLTRALTFTHHTASRSVCGRKNKTCRREVLNRRQPIFWMIVAGVVLISVLTYIPHHIRARVFLGNAAALVSGANITGEETQKPKDEKPSFDAAAWYLAREESPETHGVLIETLDGSRTLASLNPDVAFNPASLVKLATSLT